jgi:hypothetical protein
MKGTGSMNRPVDSASMFIPTEQSTLETGKRTNRRALELRHGWMEVSMRETIDKARRMVKTFYFLLRAY